MKKQDEKYLFNKREFLNDKLDMIGAISGNIEISRPSYSDQIEQIRKEDIWTSVWCNFTISDCTRSITLSFSFDEDDDSSDNYMNDLNKLNKIINHFTEFKEKFIEARILTQAGTKRYKEIREENKKDSKEE